LWFNVLAPKKLPAFFKASLTPKFFLVAGMVEVKVEPIHVVCECRLKTGKSEMTVWPWQASELKRKGLPEGTAVEDVPKLADYKIIRGSLSLALTVDEAQNLKKQLDKILTVQERRKTRKAKGKPETLDRILEALPEGEDEAVTLTALAEKLGVSEKTVRTYVKSLEAEGKISSITVEGEKRFYRKG